MCYFLSCTRSLNFIHEVTTYFFTEVCDKLRLSPGLSVTEGSRGYPYT